MDQDKETLTEYDNPTPMEITLKALYDYILESDEYNLLAKKTQVLNSGVDNPGLNITTRKDHDIQVSNNATKLAKMMGMKPYGVLMSQIAGLAHDIGHTPFGHDGESFLRKELKKFGSGYGYKHEDYGAEILENLIKEFYVKTREGKIPVPEGFNPAYVMIAKYELKRAVKNHSQYYGFKVAGETKVEQCVRLADTLSFMVTDLSDLMRGYTKDGKEPIVSRDRVLKELSYIPGMSPTIVNEVIPMIDMLKEGDKSQIELLQEMLLKESLAKTRKGDVVCTIIDDIKLEQNIISAMEGLQRSDTPRSRVEAIKAITTYYGYLVENSHIAEQNIEFQRMVEMIIGKQNPKECYQALSDLHMHIRDEEINAPNNEQEKIINKLLGRESNNLLESVKKHKNSLIARDLKVYPRLMTIFALQNSLQYEQILKQNPERLGNGAIERTDELGNVTTQSLKEVMEDTFSSILKMAYAVHTNPKKYTTDNPSNVLKMHNGKQVPNYGGITYEPILYTLNAFQQMSNNDFKDGIVLHMIANELHIKPEKRREIEEIDLEEIRDNATGLASKKYNVRTIVGKKSMFIGKGLYRPTSKETLKESVYSARDVLLYGVEDFMAFNKSAQIDLLEFITKEMDKKLGVELGEDSDKGEQK